MFRKEAHLYTLKCRNEGALTNFSKTSPTHLEKRSTCSKRSPFIHNQMDQIKDAYLCTRRGRRRNNPTSLTHEHTHKLTNTHTTHGIRHKEQTLYITPTQHVNMSRGGGVGTIPPHFLNRALQIQERALLPNRSPLIHTLMAKQRHSHRTF